MTDSPHPSPWLPASTHPGILRECVSEKNQLVLWLPSKQDGKFQYWERIGTVPRAEVTRQQGFCSIAASAIRVKQSMRGFFGSLLSRFRRDSENHTWLLPNGETAEQCGKRQTDLLLVWTEDQSQPMDEAQVRENWPRCVRVQSLGPHLFLLQDASSEAAHTSVESLPSEDSSKTQAEQLLDAARRNGDRIGEAFALTDLGVLALEQGDNPLAVARLEEALTLSQAFGGQSFETDILTNLGLVVLRTGQPEQARRYLEQALTAARAGGDRYAEKFALERMGTVHAVRGDLPTALHLLAEALELAHTLGDRQHEAELLWHIAIRQAELGQRERAMEYGQTSIRLLDNLGSPEVRVYSDHLEKYRQGEIESLSSESRGEVAGEVRGMAALSGKTVTQSTSLPDRSGPGYLRMAVSAAKALTRFIGSGLRTVTAETYQERLRQCAECNYHTGLRCRICGCFTNLKARLPHEQCPLDRWPVLASSESPRRK